MFDSNQMHFHLVHHIGNRQHRHGENIHLEGGALANTFTRRSPEGGGAGLRQQARRQRLHVGGSDFQGIEPDRNQKSQVANSAVLRPYRRRVSMLLLCGDCGCQIKLMFLPSTSLDCTKDSNGSRNS